MSENLVWAFMRLQINGETRDVPDGIDLRQLIEQLALSRGRVAVELNRAVIRQKDWPDVMLAENDSLEIVHFIGGG